MLRRILIAVLLAFPVLPNGARAQSTYETSVEGSGYENLAVGEFRDQPCEYSYGTRFPTWYGAEFEGQMFRSEWRSKRSDFPLPAYGKSGRALPESAAQAGRTLNP
jgi:hypothetical protein